MAEQPEGTAPCGQCGWCLGKPGEKCPHGFGCCENCHHCRPQTTPARVIWKFVLDGPECAIDLPLGHVVRHVEAVGDDVCMWVELNPSAPSVPRRFVVVPTGGDVPIGAMFLGTTVMYEGLLVWHVYEVRS